MPLRAILAILLLACASPAFADAQKAIVVDTCDTTVRYSTPGQEKPVLMDKYGRLCRDGGLPTGAATEAKQDVTNTDLGAPGAIACATDTGSCSINALVQRLAQRLTTVISTLGTPLQAGGNVAVTSSALPTGAATAAQQSPALASNADQSVSQPTVCSNLLATVPNGTYAVVEAQNQSTNQLQFVMDDGSATPGTVSVQIMAPAATSGAQGGGASQRPFKGRVRVCGTPSSQFMLRYQ